MLLVNRVVVAAHHSDHMVSPSCFKVELQRYLVACSTSSDTRSHDCILSMTVNLHPGANAVLIQATVPLVRSVKKLRYHRLHSPMVTGIIPSQTSLPVQGLNAYIRTLSVRTIP